MEKAARIFGTISAMCFVLGTVGGVLHAFARVEYHDFSFVSTLFLIGWRVGIAALGCEIAHRVSSNSRPTPSR